MTFLLQQISERGNLQYQMRVVSDRTSFSAKFDADDDETAFAHVKAWARGARVPRGGLVHIIRSDKSEIDATEAVEPYLDQTG